MEIESARRAVAPISAPGGAIDFRPVTEADFARIATWLATPHVARWWGDPGKALARIRDATTDPATLPFVILMDGRPVGYIQRYDMHAEQNHPYRDQPPGTVGIDLSIGEAGLVGKGHGPRIIEAFVRRLFGEGVRRVVIDPDPANTQAVRAYEKAGFRAFDRRTTIYGPALMMARDADLTTRE
jgi:aminoglycoside 6'-N-acetyltransferase